MKLKEVKAKSEDSGNKPRQFLEGLLKIPFNVYRQEKMMTIIPSIKADYLSVLELFKKNGIDFNFDQASLWRLSEAEILYWLAQITIPVELLVFAIDTWPDHPALFSDRQAAVAQLSTTLMRGSHHLHMEHPEPVAHWLLARLL